MRINAQCFTVLIALAWLRIGMLYTWAAEQPPARRGIFILKIDIGQDIPTSSRDLLARINQEIPKDLLEQKNLHFEDLTAYSDIQKWNPEDFVIQRRPDNIDDILRAKQMQEMLTLSISFAPFPNKKRLLLSGRRYDLEHMTCILTPTRTARQPTNDVTNCHNNQEVTKAFREATVDLEDYDAIQPALRTLFARLFQIPEIEILNHPTDPIEPGSSFVTHFSVKTNGVLSDIKNWKNRDGQISSDELDDIITSSAEIKKTSVDNGFSSSIVVMEAERTLPDEICRNPAKYMENGLSFTKDQKQDNSDRWLLAEGTKIVGRSATKVIDFVELFPNQNRGFGLIEKTSKVFDSDYILRIQLSAKEKGASVISYPIYQCIRAREQRTVMSLSWKPGFPVSSTTGARADGYLGVDLFFGYNVRLWGWYMLPGLTIGGVLGYSWTTRDGERAVLNYRAIEFRPHLDLELMRIPVASGISISLSGVLDIGIGANEYKYHSSIDRSGWSAVSLVGGGGKLSIRAPSVLQIGLSGIVQQRSHRSSIDGLSQSDPMIASDVTVAWLVFELMFRIRR